MTPSLQIRLDHANRRPGEAVTGTVDWRLTDTSAAESVAISLLWFTEGKGSEDGQTVDRQEVTCDRSSGSAPFSFALPAYPWSFSGRLISVVWAIEASLEPDGEVVVERFVAAPTGDEIELTSVAESTS